MSVPRSTLTARAGGASRSHPVLVAMAAGVIALLAACGSSSTLAPAASPSAAGGGGSSPSAAAASPSASVSQAAASPSTAGGGGGTIQIPADPCAVLNVTDLQMATGKAFADGQKQTAGQIVECDWSAGSATMYLVIGPLDANAFAAGKSVHTAVTDLGVDAYQVAKPSELHAADSNLEITVQISLGGDAAADAAAEEAVMRVVLVKLAT